METVHKFPLGLQQPPHRRPRECVPNLVRATQYREEIGRIGGQQPHGTLLRRADVGLLTHAAQERQLQSPGGALVSAVIGHDVDVAVVGELQT